MNTLLAALLFTAAAFSGNSLAYGEPQERKDLAEKLQAVLCSEHPDLTAQKTLSLGIHDAQIDARLVESVAGNFVSARMLTKKAKALASMKHFHGYALGICGERKGWVAAIPAPAPLSSTGTGFTYDLNALKRSCRAYRVDYAALHGGTSVKVPTSGSIDAKKLGAGMVEVTCQPSFPRWIGPVVWYLAPTSGQFAAMTSDRKTSASDSQTLSAWISAVRKNESLEPLVSSDALANAAELLSIDTSVTHNRSNTDGLRSRVKASSSLEILGELRVRGQNVDDLIWMLWHSPRHRDLILANKATNIGLHVKSVGTELLAVVLSAHESRPVTAAREIKKPLK